MSSTGVLYLDMRTSRDIQTRENGQRVLRGWPTLFRCIEKTVSEEGHQGRIGKTVAFVRKAGFVQALFNCV